MKQYPDRREVRRVQVYIAYPKNRICDCKSQGQGCIRPRCFLPTLEQTGHKGVPHLIDRLDILPGKNILTPYNPFDT